MSTDHVTWTDVVNSNNLGFSAGYDLGYSHGWAAAQEQAEQGVINRQVARAGVANIGTEIARAKADGREPRLYAQGVAR